MKEKWADLTIFTKGTLQRLNPSSIAERGALLLVDKPSGWTSFDVVAKTRNTLGIKKVGHTGTLDPLATGLLILCLGKATKLAEVIQSEKKEYVGTIRLGATTKTDDAEGEEENIRPAEHVTLSQIRTCAHDFIGESLQTPPMFSARKVKGKRLYVLARKGKEVDRPAKPINVYEFETHSLSHPHVSFRITCSKGTYIRALARDLGEKLETGAYLSSLRRTGSGDFRVEDGIDIEELKQYRSNSTSSVETEQT